MFISEDEAREILAVHEPRISAVMDRAFARLANMADRASFDLKRTRRTVMHQFLMNELRREYKGDKDVHLMEEDETIRLLVKKKLVVRIKKMDRRGMTRAQVNATTLSFIMPDAPLELPFAASEVPPSTPSIDAGYVLNDLETKIDRKLVAARNNGAVVWSYEFGKAAAATADATLITPPKQPPAPANIISVPGPSTTKKSEG